MSSQVLSQQCCLSVKQLCESICAVRNIGPIRHFLHRTESKMFWKWQKIYATAFCFIHISRPHIGNQPVQSKKHQDLTQIDNAFEKTNMANALHLIRMSHVTVILRPYRTSKYKCLPSTICWCYTDVTFTLSKVIYGLGGLQMKANWMGRIVFVSETLEISS